MKRQTTRKPPTVTPAEAAKAMAECVAKGWVKPQQEGK
jgi:hypothetical protein